MQFQLFCVGPPPALNIGEAAGTIHVVRGVGLYHSADERWSCTIRFRFGHEWVQISEIEGGTGCPTFGAGVQAFGMLRRVSTRRPRFHHIV